jgi:hypothetical protein
VLIRKVKLKPTKVKQHECCISAANGATSVGPWVLRDALKAITYLTVILAENSVGYSQLTTYTSSLMRHTLFAIVIHNNYKCDVIL